MKKHLPALRTLPGYEKLRKQVQETLIAGQRQVEWAKILTYHTTGKLILKEILNNQDHAEYGDRVIEKLAKDLEISPDIFWRCVRFARKKPILATSPESQLTWSHYIELIRIPDDKLMLDFEKRAGKKGWTSRELARKIREEGANVGRGDPRDRPLQLGANTRFAPTQKSAPFKLVGKLGTLYTYPLSEAENPDELSVELGFEMTREIPKAEGLKIGGIIESTSTVKKKKRTYSYHASKRTEEDLYTYRAKILKIIDALFSLFLFSRGKSTEPDFLTSGV